MSEGDVLERSSARGPVTQTQLVEDLRALGLRAGATVLVHSSLSALGWVCGGPVAVIDALLEVLGASGTLMMPTHTSVLSEPSHWCNPPVPDWWWPIIRDNTPAYRPDVTPTLGMGIIPETFRKMDGVLRSTHPQDSFAAFGPQAARLTEGHALERGLGEGSPLGRLYALDGSVLLLGVDHDSNTSLHLAEDRVGPPLCPTRREGAPMWVDGAQRWVEFDDLDWDSEDFPKIGQAFERETSHVAHGAVGHGTAKLMPQRPLVDFAEVYIRQHRKQPE